MIEVDARGLSCPEPVMMAQAAMKSAGTETIRVLVSSATSRDNVKTMATRKKRMVEIEEMGQDFAVVIS